jgi:hypothetical protein
MNQIQMAIRTRNGRKVNSRLPMPPVSCLTTVVTWLLFKRGKKVGSVRPTLSGTVALNWVLVTPLLVKDVFRSPWALWPWIVMSATLPLSIWVSSCE